MRRGRTHLLALIVIAAASLAITRVAAGPAEPDALADGFRNPPASARPHTWWHWINGNITAEGITADLEAMKRVGIGGAQIFNVDVGIPAGAAPFMGDRWRAMIRHAAQEADRLSIELCIHNGAGWSSSGGPWVTPEHAMQVLVWTEKPVHGPAHFADTLAQPAARNGFYRDVAVLAVRVPPGEAADPNHKLHISGIRAKAAFERGDRLQPDTAPTPPGMATARDGVVDVTAKMDRSGRLTWDVPEGDWVIQRIGHTPTGETNHPAPPSGLGLECDKLSRAALDEHWSGMMATVLKEIGPLGGRTLNNVLIDSYEVGSQNWTPRFREEFRQRRGYDPLPLLPVVTGRVIDSTEVSERFLWDLRRTVCDLFADNYYGYFADLCHQHGLRFSTEAYGNGSFDDLECGGRADIPMGEFWVGGGTLETAKLAASSGHTYGRPVIGAEAFTADEGHARWMEDPYSLKALGDLVYCLGVNRYIFHRYAMQPWLDLKPGMTMGPWGTNFERTNTWWEPSAAWMRYIARCQYLLQQGRFVADACYFEGEEGPNTLPGRAGLRPEMPAGYDYDGCDAEVLRSRLSVRDGRLALPGGTSYRLLILPESRFMTPSMLGRIASLVREGAVALGPPPAKSPSLAGYPGCDDQVRRLAADLWGAATPAGSGEHAYGRGRVIWGKSPKEVLDELRLPPDFTYASPVRDARLTYIHRHAGDAEIYFVSNQRYRGEEAACTFRVSGRVPELWSPDTGAIRTAPVYEEKEGRVTVPLRFDPAGSVFVVFRRPARGEDHLISLTRGGGETLPPHPAPRIEVRSAFYEPANGQGGGTDVTAKVVAMVAAGDTSIAASNENFGDPAPNVVKRLRVEYTLDGKPMRRIVAENETLALAGAEEAVTPPSFDVTTSAAGDAVLEPWQAGRYELRSARGEVRTVNVPAGADNVTISGAWDLHFPPGWGAPEAVRLDRLISWSEHPDPGVRYFSGTAAYTKEFELPEGVTGSGRAVMLDLGRLKNLAAVQLNGHDLGVLWKAPFRVDVSGIAKVGRNRLSVRVTNLWPNRLIGDEQLPEDADWHGATLAGWPQWLLNGQRPPNGRHTFTTWRFFNKNSPLLESGLIGPVVVRSVRKIVLGPGRS